MPSMAQIHPKPSLCTSCNCSSERETFTVWMKSLVLHGNGCTVFNSEGVVAFRVDNYQQRCSSKVLLMDTNGQVLFSINRKKLRIFGCWEGIKWVDSGIDNKPWFQVTRDYYSTILSKAVCCQVNLGSGRSWYKIKGLEGKSTLKIVDYFSGQILAEVMQKQSSIEGVDLGDDVLQLIVEPEIDHALIVALITAYSLMNHKL